MTTLESISKQTIFNFIIRTTSEKDFENKKLELIHEDCREDYFDTYVEFKEYNQKIVNESSAEDIHFMLSLINKIKQYKIRYNIVDSCADEFAESFYFNKNGDIVIE